MPTAPLAGIRVVELASFVAAPAAGALLADLGAEVIKVEVPWGEIYRHSRAALRRATTATSGWRRTSTWTTAASGRSRSTWRCRRRPRRCGGSSIAPTSCSPTCFRHGSPGSGSTPASCARGGPSSSSRGSRGSGRSGPRPMRPRSTTRATGRAPVSWTCCTSPTRHRRSSGRAWATTRPRWRWWPASWLGAAAARSRRSPAR